MASRRLPLLLIPVIGLLGVTACGSDGDSTDSTTTTAVVDTTTEATEDESTASTADDEAPAAEPSPADPSEGSSPLADFDEFETLEATIPEFGDLESEIETDNPGTRVILFADGSGRKVYKSVFVKHDRHLKILNLDGGRPLFNERI